MEAKSKKKELHFCLIANIVSFNSDTFKPRSFWTTSTIVQYTLPISLQVYEFTVVAKDGGKVPLEGYAKVTVNLIDINDNHPVFELAEYQVTVSDYASVQTTITIIRATYSDIATNGSLT